MVELGGSIIASKEADGTMVEIKTKLVDLSSPIRGDKDTVDSYYRVANEPDNLRSTTGKKYSTQRKHNSSFSSELDSAKHVQMFEAVKEEAGTDRDGTQGLATAHPSKQLEEYTGGILKTEVTCNGNQTNMKGPSSLDLDGDDKSTNRIDVVTQDRVSQDGD